MFDIGDVVVHPQHGVGRIVKLEKREFERGQQRTYYQIDIPGGSTIWVPVDMPNSGLRKLARRSEIADCRAILRAQPVSLAEDGRVRQSDLAVHLKQGTMTAQAEVVRDLSAFVAHKPAYGTMPAFLQAVRGVLCQEWALVEGISALEAESEIDTLLGKIDRVNSSPTQI